MRLTLQARADPKGIINHSEDVGFPQSAMGTWQVRKWKIRTVLFNLQWGCSLEESRRRVGVQVGGLTFHGTVSDPLLPHVCSQFPGSNLNYHAWMPWLFLQAQSKLRIFFQSVSNMHELKHIEGIAPAFSSKRERYNVFTWKFKLWWNDPKVIKANIFLRLCILREITNYLNYMLLYMSYSKFLMS